MKRLLRTITANTDACNSTVLSTKTKYSSKDVYDLLLSIEELHGQKITAVENKDESCEFTIGNTTYSIATDIV